MSWLCSLVCWLKEKLFSKRAFDAIAPTVDAFDAAIPDVTDEGDLSDTEVFDLSTPIQMMLSLMLKMWTV